MYCKTQGMDTLLTERNFLYEHEKNFHREKKFNWRWNRIASRWKSVHALEEFMSKNEQVEYFKMKGWRGKNLIETSLLIDFNFFK